MAIRKYVTGAGTTKYQASLWHKNQCLESKTFDRKVDANAWLELKRTQLRGGHGAQSRGHFFTLDEFFHTVYWQHKEIRGSTASEYKSVYDLHISPRLGFKKMGKLTVEDWSAFKHGLVTEGMSKARANRVHTIASAIYTKAMKLRYVSVNPLRGMGFCKEELKAIRFWSKVETNQFMNWIRNNEPSWFSLYRFSYETGVRVSELIALNWDCLDFNTKTVTIRRSYSRKEKRVVETTKGHEARVLGLGPELLEELRKLQKKSQFVFCKDDGSHLLYEYLKNRFYKHQRLAEVPKIGIHELRHTYASHYVMNGGSVYDLMSLLGHKDVETTMRYAHLSSVHIQAKSSIVQLGA